MREMPEAHQVSAPTARELLRVGYEGEDVTPRLLILAARVEAVLALHIEYRIYDECGHEHLSLEAGLHDIEDVGLVCEEGYLYSVCRHCHTDDGEAREDTSDGSWPCPTVRLLNGEQP